MLGRDCDFAQLCRVTDQSERDALPALDELLSSQLLQERTAAFLPYRFGHDKIREVVYTEASDARRRMYHRNAVALLKDEDAPGLSPTYLIDELGERLKSGPIKFKFQVQLAAEGDQVDDATVHWPADRPVMDLGTIELTQLVTDNAKEQQHIIFDPIPRTDGIEPTADPLFELRAAIYLISGRRRRAAPPTSTGG